MEISRVAHLHAWFQVSVECLGLRQSLCLFAFASAFVLPEQATDSANQGLDEGVSGADLAVQALHLQQLPLQSFSKACSHVTLQLCPHKQGKRKKGQE